MPHEILWYIPDELIYARMYGKITVEELTEALETINATIESSPRHHVHILTDVRSVTETLSLSQLMQVMRNYKRHPRQGWAITTGEQSLTVKMMTTIASQVAGLRDKSVHSIDEALAFLRDIDNELNWVDAEEDIIPT